MTESTAAKDGFYGADDGRWNGGVVASCGTEVVQTDRYVAQWCFEREESMVLDRVSEPRTIRASEFWTR